VTDSVVVTGLGVVSPFNPDGDRERFWTSLCAGETAVGAVRSFDASPYPCHVAAEVRRDALAGEDGGDEPARHMAILAFERALQDAALAGIPCAPRRAGVIVGTVLGGTTLGERYLRQRVAGGAVTTGALEAYPLRAIASVLAERAGYAGPVLTVSTACASGTDAIGLAYRTIASGSADLVVAGGVDAVCELSFSGFCALRVLTADRVRPFARNRTGLALGEGAAFLVLEGAKTASRRGATVLGRIAGYAARSDAVHLTAPHRDGRGLAAAAAAALQCGGCHPDEVDYVNAHGTGTLYNDWMETKAIKVALGARAHAVPVSSIKGALGHAFGAAGAIEAVACLLTLRDGLVPPTANLEEPDPECDLDFVPIRARRASVQTALSLSAGFGGQNAALLLRRAA
jgi:3-oxoacyl-[acyl-carrier-protein] synthase II